MNAMHRCSSDRKRGKRACHNAVPQSTMETRTMDREITRLCGITLVKSLVRVRRDVFSQVHSDCNFQIFMSCKVLWQKSTCLNLVKSNRTFHRVHIICITKITLSSTCYLVIVWLFFPVQQMSCQSGSVHSLKRLLQQSITNILCYHVMLFGCCY